jgi:hypothetical protein
MNIGQRVRLLRIPEDEIREYYGIDEEHGEINILSIIYEGLIAKILKQSTDDDYGNEQWEVSVIINGKIIKFDVYEIEMEPIETVDHFPSWF